MFFSILCCSFTPQWLQKLNQIGKSVHLIHHHLLPAMSLSLYIPVHFRCRNAYRALWGYYFSDILHRLAPHQPPLCKRKSNIKEKELLKPVQREYYFFCHQTPCTFSLQITAIHPPSQDCLRLAKPGLHLRLTAILG